MDQYVVTKELGKGSFAVVRLAIKQSSNERVAIKCLTKEAMTDEDRTALAQEVDILRSLKHPAIIELLDFYPEEPTYYYVVLELMEGGELLDRIVAKERYSEADAHIIVRDVAECLEYLHGKDIVHRDLKAQNILFKDLSEESELKLCDFGFARFVKEGCSTICGTPYYLGPEVLYGDVYGSSVDLWALGVLTYILLSGYPPFYSQHQLELYKLIKKAKFVFDLPHWDPVSEEAKDLIRKLLEEDVRERLTIAGVLSHPWIRGKVSNTDMSQKFKTQLQLFNAKLKLRAAIRVAIAANKIKDIGSSQRSLAIPVMLTQEASTQVIIIRTKLYSVFS